MAIIVCVFITLMWAAINLQNYLDKRFGAE